MKDRISTKGMLAVMFVGIACLLLAPPFKAQSQDSIQASNLLSYAKREAISLREDADQMQYLVLAGVTWDTQAVYAKTIAKDISEMRAAVDKLDKARGSSSPWQKAAIDQINPLMKELATTTENVFETMDQKPFDKSQYYEYLEANHDHAEHLAALISEYVSYGNAKARLQKAAERISLGPKAK